MRAIDTIIIHCSDTPPSADIGVREIRQWHLARGFRDVGYHYVIRRSAEIDWGRDVSEIGAHAEGFNTASIGICLVGGRKASTGAGEFNFTAAQIFALMSLIESLRFKFGRGLSIIGHRDVNPNKECPCFDVKSFIEGWR